MEPLRVHGIAGLSLARIHHWTSPVIRGPLTKVSGVSPGETLGADIVPQDKLDSLVEGLLHPLVTVGEIAGGGPAFPTPEHVTLGLAVGTGTKCCPPFP